VREGVTLASLAFETIDNASAWPHGHALAVVRNNKKEQEEND
jgi:hypothetical protein